MKRFHLIAIAVLVVGVFAAGCGSIPLPKEAGDYTTWVEEQDDIDVVHVQFKMNIETKGASEAEIIGFLQECSVEGMCGVMARLVVNGEVQNATLSSSCTLKNQGAESVDSNGDGRMEDTQKIGASCIVPVNSDVLFKGNDEYGLIMTSVSPRSLDFEDLVFTSSPEFAIVRGSQVTSYKLTAKL